MNISGDTSKKLIEMLNNPNAQELRNKIGSIDSDKLMALFKQLNPSEADIKRAEEKIKSMSKDEMISELIKKLKG